MAGSLAFAETEMGKELFFVVDFGLRDNLLATVETVGRNTMPQMRLPCSRQRHLRCH